MGLGGLVTVWTASGTVVGGLDSVRFCIGSCPEKLGRLDI